MQNFQREGNFDRFHLAQNNRVLDEYVDAEHHNRYIPATAFAPAASLSSPTMIAAGGSHAAGLVPDPGATPHTPPYVLGDDAAWHLPSADIGRYNPDRAVPITSLNTGASDENVGGVTLVWNAFNSGQGLALTAEYDTFRVSQSSGSGVHIVRGFWVPAPAGNWRLFIKFANEVSKAAGNTGPGQAGIGLGIGGTSAVPDHSEFLRVYGQASVDWANNDPGDAFGIPTAVRLSGMLPNNWGGVSQWIYGSFRYTAGTRLIEPFYSLTGYQWVSLGSTTPAAAAVPTSVFVWVDADSTTLLPSLRVAWLRLRTDGAGIAGASGQ